jgi:predicted dehydrogenase
LGVQPVASIVNGNGNSNGNGFHHANGNGSTGNGHKPHAVVTSEKTPIRVGVVGIGKMGILHSAVMNAVDGGQVAAFCDSQRLILSAIPQIVAGKNTFGSLETMLKLEPLDALVITTPIHLHAPLVEEAFAAGVKNIFVEKPLAGNEADSKRLASLSASRPGVHMVAYQKRFIGTFRAAKQALEAGKIGRLLSAKAFFNASDVFSQLKGWRFEKGRGGAVRELGPHAVDLISWFFGMPTKLSACYGSFYSKDVDDYCQTIARFQDGMILNLETSWSLRGYRLPEMRMDIEGSLGRITVTDDYFRIQTAESESEPPLHPPQLHYRASLEQPVPFLLADPEFIHQDMHFLDCVRTNQAPASSFASAAKTDAFLSLIERRASEFV